MAWYRVGTVNVTINSRTVVGVGTSWVQSANIGETFLGPDERLYEITAINSSTSLTISPAYKGPTSTAQSYAVMPTQGYLRDLAAQAAELINSYADVRNNAGAGKFVAGTVAAPSLRGTADENTGLRFAGNDILQLITNGVVRLQIAADGTPTGVFTEKLPVSTATATALATKQDALVSGTNIKTINGESLVGAGNIYVGLVEKFGTIGVAGKQGFGVGIYPTTLPAGFSNLPGTQDSASPNYGNYIYSDGSVMVFIPRYYYRIGHTSSPNYALYGLNAIDIAGVDTFATEAEANAAGYAMHRAFVDGGQVKHGFFFDKYICSPGYETYGRSVRYGVPISLTTDNDYTNSSKMTGCTGILADAVTLSRARGVGVFNCASIFMFDALAKLSLAHGQAATSATACAWFDPARTKNFPKGCNGNNLADGDDPSVTYQSAGDIGNAMKPKTGSASNLAKTAHNGQACGVVDISGCVYQVMLGLTQAGSSSAAAGQVTSGDAYTLKPSVKLADLTAGWGGATDAWGTGANLASRYDLQAGFLPWGADIEWVRLGNGSAQVFSPALAGTDYLRSCAGIANLTGCSVAGINTFGVDGCFRYTRENVFPLASGTWRSGSLAGAFCRNWNTNRSNDNFSLGFRAGAYGS